MEPTEEESQNAEERLIEAKIELVRAVDDFDPLEPIKDHPWISVGAAFASGLGVAASKINFKDFSFLPMILQVGNYLLKSALNDKK